MATANAPPLNFSKTQRLVLLVDLHPLLTLKHPAPYLSAVTSVASRLLHFPPLSASLSAYKLFFSSLSPLRSAAVLPRHPSASAISFNLPSQTLASISNSLDSIATLTDCPNSTGSARASYTVSSLLQLIHDYAWERENDDLSGKDDFADGDFAKIPSNLVILLSPISLLIHCLVDYLELRDFDEVFSVVRDAFAIRDIHLCWVDVKSDELKLERVDEKKNECEDKLISLKDSIRKMGWAYCSSDLIVLGSALLPLGLIYPKVGVYFDFVDFGGLENRKYRGELSLEITGVNGMPLECKICGLEFVNLQSLPGSIQTKDILNVLESGDAESLHGKDSFWVRLGKEKLKLHVKAVQRYEGHEKIGGSKEIVLVRECLQELGKGKKKIGDNFFADSVLEMLHREMGGITSKNQMPTWQMFLSFLHMKGYWALVSLTGCNGDTCTGSLKPFTTHLAILSILDASCVQIGDKSGSKRSQIDHKTGDTCNEDINNSNGCFGSQTETSSSSNCEPHGDGKRRNSRRHLYQEMTWSSFCNAAFSGSNFDLFELYIVRHYEKSKKLKFLKCWTKQITKVDLQFFTNFPGSKCVEGLPACNALMSEPSPAEEGAMPVSASETSEIYFNNLPRKIRQGLESGKDLQNLAERVVKSSIHWLHRKFDHESNSEDQQPMRKSDDSYTEAIGGKLVKLLLRSPKEMMKIHQDSCPSSSSGNVVREYELQVLLRMEILQSDVSAIIGESRKQKMLKQICSLLEIIQYLVEGGIHGRVSLYDYVERTIRTRYSNALEDIVKNIYTEMDLLPFGEEDEAPSLLFNSEDSNQSWRDKHDRNEKADSSTTNRSVSTEGEPSQPLASTCQSPQAIGEDEHARILNEARERRERARRYAPFISKARDLQRVWAPRQPKVRKCKYDSLPTNSKRKDRRTSSYSVVCETPMTGNKRTCSRENDKGGKAHDGLGNSSRIVSKALFQDN